ncbi:hypothetical protein [Adhaeretor mobilis]|uniref:Uncharacterized protein n=1 Tax=Adhaeretor mobilis TaxID=1930276 RepID=A0A517N2Y3_9BACT|nr:hypothetical protein [Adhaeretor mobilis]QDT01497.1 hypothetical protein HG15A2_48390 [Adhaeretor mobilis]
MPKAWATGWDYYLSPEPTCVSSRVIAPSRTIASTAPLPLLAIRQKPTIRELRAEQGRRNDTTRNGNPPSSSFMPRQFPMLLNVRYWVLVVLCITLAGCQTFLAPPDEALETLLQPIKSTPESVTLEVFHVRIPVELEDDVQQLWSRVDEQQVDAATRRRLTANGLRVGTVGAPLPGELTDLLELVGQPADQQASASTDLAGEKVITSLTAQPRVTRRIERLSKHEQMPITASEVRNSLHILVSDDDGLNGNEFREVEAVYSLKARAQPHQRVSLSVTPELHHGELRQRRIGSDKGIFLMTASRERESFADLRIAAELTPGEILVLGCLPDAGSSLGHAFHVAETSGTPQSKLILVRLLQVPPSEILAEK